MKTNDASHSDQLLKHIQDDERARSSAQLRVFLGMCAGVGKTYAMLETAQALKAEGIDVVVGVVETHGRTETARLLNGLEIIPRRRISYRGTDIEEMDIDAILKRKPQLVIVDELAHTNAPESRHQKRYQDVLELLRHGIGVLTALNVQHLESRKDAVESISGIRIRETVPDSILERANQIELVDIAPVELLKRLKEGKVYLGEKAATAADGFFKEDRLTALREIALRITAERVDQDLQRLSYSKRGAPWQTNERLLVAVSHSPHSEQLIRATRRLAYNLDAPWIAVHVDTGLTLNDIDQAQLAKNMALARELKAEVISTTDTDLSAALSRVCRQKNVTQLIAGRPTRRWFRELLEGGSLLRRLTQENPEVDIHFVRQSNMTPARPSFWQELTHYRTQTGWVKYWNTLWFLIFMTTVGAASEPLIGYRAVGFLFLLGILVVGLFGSLGIVLFAAAFSSIIWNFGFIPPRFTFAITQPDDMILCATYFVVALITGLLTNRIRLHERLLREREERTSVLYQISQDIAISHDSPELIERTTLRTGDVLGADCGVILQKQPDELAFDEESDLDVDSSALYALRLDTKDQAVAAWSFQNRKSAGWSTDTLSEAQALYLPLEGAESCVGVFVFRPRSRIRKLNPDQEALLGAIVSQVATSIERNLLSRRVLRTRQLETSEMLHQTLLNSISHELRTPLTAILGSAAALESDLVREPYVREVAKDLTSAGNRLNRVIENLLDMSRLNSGMMTLKLEWQDLSDVVGVVLGKIGKSLEAHRVEVQIEDGMSLMRADFRLFEHAISNLLLNAAQYSPPGGRILIRGTQEGEKLMLRIEDDGPGIPPESIPHIFEKFYRAPGSPPGGTGLGLSIVSGIIELHEGTIRFENVKPHGARFIVELPLEKQPELPTEIES